MMILVTYYNKDRIGYRIIGVTNTIEEASELLTKQAKFDRKDFANKIKNHGIYVTPAGFMIMDTTRNIDTSHGKYYLLGLPYSTEIALINNFQSFAKSYIRNFKIKKII
jgi:hypothetical protein